MDAKSFREKMEALYSGVDPTDRKQDDTLALRDELLSIKAQERYADPEYKEKHRQALEKTYSNPDWQRRMKELGQDPKANASRSKASKAIWKDKEKAKQIKEKRLATMATEEYQEKMKEVYSDPDRLARAIEGGRTQAKSITTPDGIFEATTDAAKHYGITPQALRARTKTQPHLFYYTEDGPGEEPPAPIPVKKEKYVRKVRTPDGVFDNLQDAAKHYKVHTDTIKYRCKNVDGYEWSEDRPEPKKVITPDGEFNNIKEAAKHYSKTTKTIRVWMKNNPNEYYFKESK